MFEVSDRPTDLGGGSRNVRLFGYVKVMCTIHEEDLSPRETEIFKSNAQSARRKGQRE